MAKTILIIEDEKAIQNVSSVAKRMTILDMTWKCDVERNDEIGVLASSLNKMSERLSDALDSLQRANEQLQADVIFRLKRKQLRLMEFTK